MPIVQGAGASAETGNNIIGQVKITNGSLVASILDLTNSDPLAVAIVDGSGDQITSFGGGTQYTEGATDSSITGTAMLWEDTSDTLRAVSAASPLPVAIISGAGSGGTASADDADFTAGTTSGTPAMGVYESSPTSVTDGDMGIVGITQTRALRTAVEGSVAVTGTFWQATQPVSAASLPLPTGAATAAAQLADNHNVTANAGTNLNTSALLTTAAHDAAFGTAGSADSQVRSIQGIASMVPVQVGDNSASLSVDWNGTQPVTGSGNATGALRVELPTNGTGVLATVGAVTTVSTVSSVTQVRPPDIDVTGHTNYARKYYTSAGAATDGIIWSPAAGKRWHLAWLWFQVSAACTVTFEDDKSGGDDPVLKGEFAANSGGYLVFPEKYPMASGEDAADLLVTTSAGNIYVACGGYEV